MIDQAFQTIAEQIHGVLMPGINQAIFNAMHNNVFQHMTTDQIQIACIKIALEAMAFAVLYWIGRTIGKRLTSRKRRSKPRRELKTVPERRWTPTGWYWDDKKQSWIPPDYLSEESRQRWKWDPEKRIWIDQDPPKE